MRVLGASALSLALTGCLSAGAGGGPGPRVGTPAAEETYRAPHPGTASLRQPGGDASDPERAALERLASEPFRSKWDRYGTMHIYLPDVFKFSLTHIMGVKTRQAFHYGDDRYAAAAVWYLPAEGPDDPDACLARFLESHRSTARLLGVSIAREERRAVAEAPGAPKTLAAWVADADVNLPLHVNAWVGALVAKRSWPGTCLVQGLAVVATDHPALARRAVDRWIAEGAPKLAWGEKVTSAPTFEMSN